MAGPRWLDDEEQAAWRAYLFATQAMQASFGDIEAAYPEWSVVDEQAFDVSGARFYRHVKNPDPRFYRLRRD